MSVGNGEFRLEDMSPVTLTFVIALVSAGVLVFGMFVVWTIHFVPGVVIFAIGALGVIGSPLLGLLVWWAYQKYDIGS
ncbi:hypothetical protein [Halomontanus rarus]|uniref:hypothetical protein n=1 Tax=Halomontanus rarus TaxID=3034020 RepID=UPI001A98FC23|nr:hypothetical protein [Halovivax sp. TS33]